MQRKHEDKATPTPPGQLLGREEWVADMANAEAWREANLAPDEAAARPTADEQRRLDAAMAAWDEARAATRAAGEALRAALAELRAKEGTSIFRGAGGVPEERPNASVAELDALERAIAAARRTAEEAARRESEAQLRFNETNASVAAAGAARRRSIRAEADFAAWHDRHPDASERELAEAREMYGLQTGLLDWIRVRIGGGR